MKKKHLLLVVILAFLALFTIFSLECSAFKTGFPYEAIHEDIISKALKPSGFTHESLSAIINGANSQDALSSPKFTDSPHHHCDDNLIKESIAYFRERFSKALEYCKNSYKPYGVSKQQKKVKDTLYTFGEGLHTIQDFYSHSNYVEMLTTIGNKDELADFNALPKGIKTGYFYWNGYTDNEKSRSRATCVAKIKEHYKQKGQQLNFHTEAQWKARMKSPTFSEATAYVLDPNYQCIHYELNKDRAAEWAGSVKLPDNRTMHSKARTLAILETKRQWKEFKKAIVKKYGKQSQLIITALKGYDLPVIKLKLIMPPKAREGKPIPIQCSIALNYSDMERNLKQKNPNRYDLQLRASVYKEGKEEVSIKKEIEQRSVGSTGGISFNLPPLTGTGPREVYVKVMFVGDKRYKTTSANKKLTITGDSLVNSKWQIKANFRGSMGTRYYSVKVIDDNPESFSVRVMGRLKGNTPAIFPGTRSNNTINLKGWRNFKVTKIVGSNGSIDKLNAGRVVETGEVKKQNFNVTAKLNSEETMVAGTINKNTKFTGKRID